MASKVNSRFVAILACVLIILFGGVTLLAYVSITRSGDRYIRKGDEAMAAGDVKKAASFYERAVGKKGGRTKREWLEKWRGALLQTVPENPLDYSKAVQFHAGIERAIAELEPENAEQQLVYIEGWYRQIKTISNSRPVLEDFVAEVAKRIEELDPEDPKTKRIIGYRGLAMLDLMGRLPTSDEERAQSLSDLELAASDPANTEAGLGLARWHFTTAEIEQRAGRRADADASNLRGKEALDAFMAANPKHPEGMLQSFAARRAITLTKLTTVSERQAAMAAMRPEIVQLLDDLLALDPKEMTGPLLGFMRVLLPIAGDQELTAKYLALIERARSVYPDAADLMLVEGQALEDSGRPDDAITAYQRVVDLPPLPVSLDGLLLPIRQRMAVGAQVDACITQWDTLQDREAGRAALDRAKVFRDKLATLVDVTTEGELKKRDALIALAEGRFDVAVALLSSLRSTMQGDDPAILLPLAEALYRQGNMGESRLIYERLRADGYRAPSLMFRLAELYLVGLQDTVRAREVLTELLQNEPGNERAKEQIARIDVIEGNVTDATADPVLLTLVQAAELQSKGELGAARTLLAEQLKKTPKERRLFNLLIQLDIADNDRAAALERIKAAIAAAPEDQQLKQMEMMFSVTDPVEAGLKLIEQSGGTPLQRALSRFQLYNRHNKMTEARAAYRDAESIAPNDPAVIEIGFVVALEERDWEKARAFVARAAEQNLDQLNGALFQGRFELARGQSREAAATFKRAADKIPEKPDTWRWLGAAQVMSGDVQNAISSYQRALDARPSDIQIGKEYTRALMAVGRQRDALAAINPTTGLLRYGTGDSEAVGMWLDLEGLVGDREVAIERRRLILGRSPKDGANAESLARLQIVDNRFEDAAATIAIIEENKSIPALNIALLRGELAARSGDADAAVDGLRTFISGVPESERTSQMYTRSAELLARHERQPQAVELLTEGRKYQSKDRLEADRQLGDLLVRTGITGLGASERAMQMGDTARADEFAERGRNFLQQAGESYQSVIAAGADTAADGFAVSKRLAEVHAKLGDNRKADAVIQAMIDRMPADQRAAMENDREVLLLRSQFAKGANDVRRARELLDRACERYPSDPVVFVRRAMLNEEDESLFADVIADLDRALMLRPGMSEAWGLRFSYFKERGRLEEAFNQIRKGIESNPSDNSMKMVLVQQMLNEGRTSDAVAEAVGFARANMEDQDWLRIAADLCLKNGQYREASEFYYTLYTKEPESSELAGLVLDTLLLRRDQSINRAEVMNLLRVVESEPKRTRDNLMLRARARVFLGDQAKAAELAQQAFELCGEDTRELAGWFTQLTSVVGSQEFAYKLLGQLAGKGQLPPIIRVARFGDSHGAKPAAEQNAELAAIEKAIKPDDNLAWLEFSRLMVRVAYGQGRYEDLVTWGKRGLEISPTDGELNNNVAYVLVKHLNRASEALTFAERASAVNPSSSSVLDTLGTVYLKLDRYQDAERELTRAVQTAQGPEELLTANMHLAQALLKLGDVAGARRAATAAQTAFGSVPAQTQALYKAELDSLREAVK